MGRTALRHPGQAAEGRDRADRVHGGGRGGRRRAPATGGRALMLGRVTALLAVAAAAVALIAASGSGPAAAPARLTANVPPAPDARVPADPAALAPRLAGADRAL